MGSPRFSTFEVIVYAFKAVLDNIRLFVLAGLVKMAFFLVVSVSFFNIANFLLFVWSFQRPYSKNLWEQCPKIVELVKSFSAETLKAYIKQLWTNVSWESLYYIIFFLIVVIVMLLMMGIYLGFIRLVLKLHDTGSSTVELLFSCFGLAPKAFIATILFGLMVGFGSLLFVIPGIYFMLRGLFFPYFIVDKNAGIIDSIKKSFEVTKGQVWPLFGLVLIAPLMLRFGPAGLFAITPLITASHVYVYRKIA